MANTSKRKKSCYMCGYGGWRSAKARLRDGFSIRCHGFDDDENPEALLIPHGAEVEIACKCPQYYRRSEHMTLGEFVAWRNGVKLEASNRVTEQQFRIITLILAGASLIDFAMKLTGKW